MRSEFEKMRGEEEYDFTDPEVQESYKRAKMACRRLLTMTHYDYDYREAIEEAIPGFPKSSVLCPPFCCDHVSGITIGENVFINCNATMLNSATITIGDNVLIGPECHLYTPNHPFDHLERRKAKEQAHPIVIGDDCWLGGNVTVCPGVTIGPRCIIAAGSVVVSDIPADSLAAGNPAVVKRKL